MQGLPNSGVPRLFAPGAHIALLFCMYFRFSSKLKYPWAWDTILVTSGVPLSPAERQVVLWIGLFAVNI